MFMNCLVFSDPCSDIGGSLDDGENHKSNVHRKVTTSSNSAVRLSARLENRCYRGNESSVSALQLDAHTPLCVRLEGILVYHTSGRYGTKP